MIWATASPRSCFCWLYRMSPSLAAKNIINLISVLTIWLSPAPCYPMTIQPCSLPLGQQGSPTFIIEDWNAKVGSQEIPGVTGKFGLGIWNEAVQRLIEIYQENALVISNTVFQEHKRRLYTWISPDGQYPNQVDYILCSQRWRHSNQSAKTRPGADCGSDHELLIAKFRLKLKKVGKPLDHSGMT